jgi:O-antigen/teichoic acid export membrane protein
VSAAPDAVASAAAASAAAAAPAVATGDARHQDAAHAARSGFLQILTMIGNGLLPLHRVLVARLFGQTAYGIYRTAADLGEVATRAGMAGSDKALLRFVAAHRVAGEPEAETRALGSALRLAGGVLLALTIALAAAAPLLARVWGKPEYGRVVPLLAPSVLGYGLALVLCAATLAAKVTRVNLAVRGVAEPFLLIGLTLVAWQLRPTAAGAAVAHAAAYVTLAVLAWVGATRVFGRGKLRAALRAPADGKLRRFAIPMGASELMNAILQRANVFILAAFAGAPTVAVFAAAEELGRSAAGIRYAFDSVVSPLMAESLHQRDHARLRYNLALTTRWVASASAPIALTLLALRPELLALYGPHYGGGAAAMALLVLGHLVNGVLGLTPYVMVMSGRSRLFFWNNLGAALLNLGLSFALIPRHGVTGAAVASLASVAALQGALALQVYWLERVHPFAWPLAKPFLAAAIALAAELGVRALPLPALARVAAVIAAGAVVYPMALLALRPGDEERRFVLGLLRRMAGRAPRERR